MPRAKKRRPGLSLLLRGQTWYVRGTVGPTGKRERVYESTGTGDRTRAEAYRARRENEAWDRAVFGARAVITFAEAALSYLTERRPSPGNARRVDRLVAWFGTRRLMDIRQEAMDQACAGLLKSTAAPGTKLRAVYIPVTAILTHAAKRGWCDRPIFDRPRQPKGRTAWLTPAQAVALCNGAAAHLRPIILFGLCTGGRVSEILDLEWGDVDLTARTCVFRDTKNGRDRIVQLAPRAVLLLAALEHRHGAVFRKPGPRRRLPDGCIVRDLGEPYADKGDEGGGQFKTAWRTACRRAGLCQPTRDALGRPLLDAAGSPVLEPSITPHGLRHTWATWFYASTRDALRLMHAGGWSGLALVERYAHLMTTDLVPTIASVWGAVHPDQFGAQNVHPFGPRAEAPARSTG